MNQNLLSLKPKRFLCPYCGEWHEWHLNALDWYNSDYSAELECSNASESNRGCYAIYFYENYCYYSTRPMCRKANQSINGKIPISSIIESVNKSIVTFDVPFTARSNVGKYECSSCLDINTCICVKLGDKGDNCHMTIKLGFEFEQSDYNQFAEVAISKHKKRKSQECEMDLKEQKDSIVSEAQVSQQPQVKENKEDTTMANKIFNMNMEFGPNNDENIASTLMGIAVKNGDSWRIRLPKRQLRLFLLELAR